MDIVTQQVAVHSAAITEHRIEWTAVHSLLGGTREMRAKGRVYLPQEPKEEDEDYLNRLNRTTLDNYFNDGVTRATTKAFSKDIVIKDAPTEIDLLSEDIDNQERNFTQFAKEAFRDAVAYGVSYIVVDYPKLPNDEPFSNRADELSAGLRPYLVAVTPYDVIDARSISYNGVEKLGIFRYFESVSELDTTGINEVAIMQIREYRQLPDGAGNPGPVQYNIYRKVSSDGNWYLHESGLLSTSAIPVSPVYANRSGFFMGKPPFMDLVDLNLQHWRLSSDLANILHIVSVPFLFAKGLSAQIDTATGKVKKELEVNIRRAIIADNPDASVTWVEHTGASISTLMEQIAKTEQRMANMAQTVQTRISGNETATSSAINSAEMNSNLKSMALSLQDALNTALYFLSEYLGIPTYGSASVNTQFAADFVSNDTFTMVMDMFSAGLITRDAVLAEAQRRGILDTNADLSMPDTPPVNNVVTQAPVGMQAQPMMQ
jgi:hypothetical protein